LKILGYNDYIRKFILNKFSDQYSTSVDWTILDTPEQMVQMMQSSSSNWDLIVSVTSRTSASSRSAASSSR